MGDRADDLGVIITKLSYIIDLLEQLLELQIKKAQART